MEKKKKILFIWLTLLILGLVLYLLLTPVPYKEVKSTAVLTVVKADPVEAWRDFSPVNQLFSVSMPNLPQHVTSTVALPNAEGSIRYDVYLAQARVGTTFIINAIQYPDSYDTSNPDAVLQAAAEEMVNGNPSNKLVREERGVHQGLPSSDFTLKNQDVGIRSRAILKGKRLYVLTVADRDPQVLQDSFSRFANSFKVENK